METGIYQHFKGGYYQVLGVAQHSETKEEMVVYISLDATLPGPRMFVRPQFDDNCGFSMMIQSRDLDKEPHRPRFEYIGDEIPEEE